MDKPLHVRVAEALGWINVLPFEADGIVDESNWTGDDPSGEGGFVPNYDTDWSATGPLIEKNGIAIFPTSEAVLAKTSFGRWTASILAFESCESGPTPLIAVCNLILALAEAGKLKAA